MLLELLMKGSDARLESFWLEEKGKSLAALLEVSEDEEICPDSPKEQDKSTFQPQHNDIVIELTSLSDDDETRTKVITHSGTHWMSKKDLQKRPDSKKSISPKVSAEVSMDHSAEVSMDHSVKVAVKVSVESDGDTCEEETSQGEPIDVVGQGFTFESSVRHLEETMEDECLPQGFTLDELLETIVGGRDTPEAILQQAWKEISREIVDLRRTKKTMFQVERGRYRRLAFFLHIYVFHLLYRTETEEGPASFVYGLKPDISFLYHWVYEGALSNTTHAVEQVVKDWDTNESLLSDTKTPAKYLPGFWKWFEPYYAGKHKIFQLQSMDVHQSDKATVQCCVTQRHKSKNAMMIRCLCRPKNGKSYLHTQPYGKGLARCCYLSLFFVSFYSSGPTYIWSKMSEYFDEHVVGLERHGHTTMLGKCAIFLLEQRRDLLEYLCLLPFEYRKAMNDLFGVSHDGSASRFEFLPGKIRPQDTRQPLVLHIK